MKAKTVIIALAGSFILWIVLEYAGVGLSYAWYFSFCAAWIFAPWVWVWVWKGMREAR